MYFARFATAGGGAGLGVLPAGPDGDYLIDLSAAAEAGGGSGWAPAWSTDLASVLSAGPAALETIRATVDGADERARRALSDVALLAPVRPSKVICIGLNYRDHAEETGDPLPTTPIVFAKFPSAVTGPHAPIVYPDGSHRLDYEGELGVVIGRRTRSVTAAQARASVGGYVVVNDVTARDVQNETSQWTLGKSYDTFAPMGPGLITADEIDDPHDLDIGTWVNGEQRQKSNTSNLIFGVDELIERLSRVCTLEPGDVIATGTPGGVGIGFSPERLLSVGDEVSVSVARIGVIRSRVIAGPGSGAYAEASR